MTAGRDPLAGGDHVAHAPLAGARAGTGAVAAPPGTGARAMICVGSEPLRTTQAGSYAPDAFHPAGHELWKKT